jgi:hypothetical protein
MDSRGDEALAALRIAVAADEGTCKGRAETAAAIPDTRLVTTEAGRLQALQEARLAMALAGRTIAACARAKMTRRDGLRGLVFSFVGVR